MTAREKAREQALDWSEEQAELALQAVEGVQAPPPTGRLERHRAAMERAAALRATQTKEFDVVALVREGREEQERRSS
jgi:hypothetical protein